MKDRPNVTVYDNGGKTDDSLAIFEYHNGVSKMLFTDRKGYLSYGTYKDGKLDGDQSLTLQTIRLWRDSFLDKSMRVIKSPQSPYHLWHICMCDSCTFLDPIWETVAGGRIWTHSQGDWDSHLRQAPNDRVFTFQTVDKS